MDYDVGYKKPPKATQFKKGESGNPKGRPKGKVSLATAVQRALSERIEVTENGRKRRVSKLEVAVIAMVNRAVKGDARAMQQLLALAPLVDQDTLAPNALPETDAKVMADLVKRISAHQEANA